MAHITGNDREAKSSFRIMTSNGRSESLVSRPS